MKIAKTLKNILGIFYLVLMIISLSYSTFLFLLFIQTSPYYDTFILMFESVLAALWIFLIVYVYLLVSNKINDESLGFLAAGFLFGILIVSILYTTTPIY